MQSIGLDGNRPTFLELFDTWAAAIAADHPEAGPDEWAAYSLPATIAEFLA